ncbi:MAG TPA: hypothetical protein VNQ73_07245 [Ilumatobacter sp.]|nr:hypothetical protein [Ilumatobacter sp.]
MSDLFLLDATARTRVSIGRGLAHVAAEKLNDAPAIMATVDPHPYFPLIDHDGQGGLVVDLLTSTEQVAAYYGNRHTSYEIVESRHVAAVSSELYTFRESVATLRGVGDIGGVDSTGATFDVNSAVLFPITDAGIGGELVFTRYPFADVVSGTATPPDPVPGPAHLPNGRLAVSALHDAYLDAWRAGDTDAMLDQIDPDCRWERRLRDSVDHHVWSAAGREPLGIELSRQPGVAEIVVLNRLVSEWYVFADVQVVETSGRAARHVALHPVSPRGLLWAEMGDYLYLDEPKGVLT